ncbi:LysM peptidoglycan-binding domain-containing protein [Roseobacteraceae bacterium NS-SX3]
MAQTSDVKGLPALAIGGIASVAVVLGGVLLIRMGGIDLGGSEGVPAAREGGAPVAISPSGTLSSDDSAPSHTAGRSGEESGHPSAAERQAGADATPARSGIEAGAAAEADGADAPARDLAVLEPSAEPEQAPAAVPVPSQTGAGEQRAAAAPDAPVLDLVRVDPEGVTVIAGRATPGMRVAVMLDDAVLDEFEVPEGGEFVSFVVIKPTARAQALSLVARRDGQEIPSEATFILAPSAAAVAQAESAPAADTDPAMQTGAGGEAAAAAARPQPAGTKRLETAGRETGGTETASRTAANETSAPGAAEADGSRQAATGEEPSRAAGAGGEDASAPDVAVAQEGATDPARASRAGTGTREDTKEASANSVEPAAAPPAAAETAAEVPPQAAPKPEVPALAVLRADAGGVQLVQPASPAVPELQGKVSLDTISYSDAGEVQLAGRARPAALVRIYLDNSPLAGIPAEGDGQWAANLSDVAPGLYTLRLDEVDPADGRVLSRLETPFKREAPETLQPPAAPGTPPGEAAPLVRAVTVQKGDTLWAISREKYGSGFLYVRVFEANMGDIRNPDLIYPGQVFTIPE